MPRLLYIVSHAFPHSSNGYAVRTHGLAKALVAKGIDLVVLTKPGRPWDLPGFDVSALIPLEQVIDGVRYVCVPEPSKKQLKGTGVSWLELAANEIRDTIKVFRPDAVMAGSNWDNAEPAQKAAKDAGLPFFYEVRGFWEYSKATRIDNYEQSDEYARWHKKEADVAAAADKVYTLTRQMRDELVERGVASSRIQLLPNGADGDILSSAFPQPQYAMTIGYVGSFSVYEGLGVLVQTLAKLRDRGHDVKLILVGSSSESTSTDNVCQQTEELRQLAEDLGVEEHVQLPGRVKPPELQQWYEKIDVVVIPRLPLKVCEIVSPIKPLEAAAWGRALVVSNVAPLQDMANEGGFLCYDKHNPSSLTSVLETLCLNPALCHTIAQTAQQWAVNHRKFSVIIEPLINDLFDVVN